MRTRSVVALLMGLGLALIGVACGDDGDDEIDLNDAFGGQETVEREVVEGWPDAWCSVQPGVRRDELVDAMGEPTSETPESLSWDGFNYQFNAFLNVNGSVRQMDINTIMLSEREIAELPCDDIRTL